MSYENSESTSLIGSANTGQPVHPAPHGGRKSGTDASPSGSSGKGQRSSATTAGTAAGFAPGKLTADALAFAEKVRKIDAETLALLGAASGTAYFPRRLERKSSAIFFPYLLDGKIVNWKACAYPEKDFIGQKGGKLCFLNLDRVLAAPPGDVYIVEGEWDMAALVQAGISVDYVMSVPNGGRDRHRDDGEEKPEDEKPTGYGYVEEAFKLGLGKHKRFIWCGDADETGYALRQDMAKLFGPAKFWFIDWPEGCKDANDMLRTDGADDLLDRVQFAAQPWPIDGLFTLAEMPEMPPIRPWTVPKLPGWNGKILLAPSTMSVVTGHPGHGKTALMAQVWADIADMYGLVVAVATFETRAKPHYRRILRTLHSGRREVEMTAEEKSRADHWINDHYRFMVHPDQKPTLDWLLDMAEAAVVRHGAKVIQLDPWNRLESSRDHRETETEYIGRCLTAIYKFAQDMGVHFQVLAHPAKMDGPRKGSAPELDDIAGSKHWDNRVDQGFVVHRPKLFDQGQRCTDAVIYHKKTRFEELGHPCKLHVNLNLQTGRFEDAV